MDPDRHAVVASRALRIHHTSSLPGRGWSFPGHFDALSRHAGEMAVIILICLYAFASIW
jgi:hypothetical protein